MGVSGPIGYQIGGLFDQRSGEGIPHQLIRGAGESGGGRTAHRDQGARGRDGGQR